MNLISFTTNHNQRKIVVVLRVNCFFKYIRYNFFFLLFTHVPTPLLHNKSIPYQKKKTGNNIFFLLYLLTLHPLIQHNSGVKNCYFLCLPIYFSFSWSFISLLCLKSQPCFTYAYRKKDYLGQDMLFLKSVCSFLLNL